MHYGATTLSKASRAAALAAASLFAIANATGSQAQTAAPAPAPATPTPQAEQSAPASAAANQTTGSADIVVSASRIVRNGFQAPTPTTVLGADDLKAQAQPNIFNAVNILPSLAGSASSTTGNSIIGAGISGISSLNLRGLGTNRTLVLVDGRRVVGATITGVTDVSQFPQDLIQRVDIVTGGASAAWGSDAVAGVVNFVIDKKFTGLKGSLENGISTYGDDRQSRVALTGGTNFADGKGHILLSGEYANQAGIHGIPRPWYNGTRVLQYSIAQTPPGNPQYLVEKFVGSSQMSRGGLIVSGPLQGTAFGVGGAPYAFQYGTRFYANNTGDPLMAGGDFQGSDLGPTTDLDQRLIRRTLYGRASYDFSDALHVWAEGAYANVSTNDIPTVNYRLANATIQCSNPYVPASVTTACAANNITSFTLGRADFDIPLTVRNHRVSKRGALGADGEFNIFGTKWTWDANIGRGVNTLDNYVPNDVIPTLFNRAIDAVRNSSGQIVCRSTLTNPTDGCIPLNIIGTDGPTPAAIASVEGTAELHSRLQEDVAGVNFNGEPFSLWAGPVSLAFGFEYRKESVTATADCLSVSNCGNALLSSGGNNFFTANFHPTIGSYNVKEAFAETVIPVLRDLPFAKSIDINAAIRSTWYSLAGHVNTWKAGATWAVNDTIKFRGTRSRDIRAPNLSDLFLPATFRTFGVIDDFAPNAGKNFLIFQVNTGNPNLKPEIADQTTAGIVLTPPAIRGFSASFDYYDIKVRNVISSLTLQQEMDLCFQGNAALCSNITRNSAGIVTQMVLQSINLAQLRTKGFDIETSYRTSIGNSSNLTLRALATHIITNKTNFGIPNQPDHQAAGENSGATPSWHIVGSEDFQRGPLRLNLTQRWISAGKVNTDWIQCTTNCPTPTLAHPTVNNNHVPAVFYLDVGGSYEIIHNDHGKSLQFFFKIDNILNKAPPAVAAFGSNAFNNPGVNPVLYDVIGRYFRTGLRFSY